MSEAKNRRDAIATTANPDPALDYVVTFRARLAWGQPSREAGLTVRYVPDRLILDVTSLDAYQALLGGGDWNSLEEVAVTVLGDINDTLVPRWIQVVVEQSTAERQHSVAVEDHQPDWHRPALLDRLARP